jgi:hypothetical protein
MKDKWNYANISIPQLYAYAKIAQGQDFSAAKKPGMFDLTVRLLPSTLPRTRPHTTKMEKC